MIEQGDSSGIPSANFGAVVLLFELHIQCSLVQRYGQFLKDAAAHWIAVERGEDLDNSAPPLEIVGDCTVVLACLSAIRRLLLEGNRTGFAQKRCASLRSLLGNPLLPNISSARVRNSWEHLDERLDELLPTLKKGSISQIHVEARDPAEGTVALKRFDPRTLTIHFVDQTLPLAACLEEVLDLENRADAAVRRLKHEVVDIWGRREA